MNNKCIPLSHLTSPSLMESANGGTITVFASSKGEEKKPIITVIND